MNPYEFYLQKKKNKDIKMVIKPYDHLEITQFNRCLAASEYLNHNH